MFSCKYQSRTRKSGQFDCSLGWHNGRPWLGNCRDCIKNNRNTPEAKAGFDAKEAFKPAIKIGCCGGAYPKLGTMAYNFAKAITDEAKSIVSGDDPINQEEIFNRISICNSCEFFIKEDGRCVKCGCFIKLKARMRSQNCPIGKW